MSFVSNSDSFVSADQSAASEQNTNAEATIVNVTPAIEDGFAADAATTSGGSNRSSSASNSMDISAAFDLVFGTSSNQSSQNNGQSNMGQSTACGPEASAAGTTIQNHIGLESTAFPQLPQSPLPTPHPSTQQLSCPSSALSANTFSLVPYDQSRSLRRHTQPTDKASSSSVASSSSSYRRSNSSTVLTRLHPYVPTPAAPTLSRRSSSSTALHANTHAQSRSTSKAKMLVIPSINHDGTIKRCSNCKQTDTPSWRRHPETQDLLCNACGLYLRLHRKCRPIAFDEDGNVQVIRKNAAIRREPVNLSNGPGQLYPNAGGFPMQFSPLPLTLMPGYQQQQAAAPNYEQQPGGGGGALIAISSSSTASFADIHAIAEPFSSLNLETNMVSSNNSAMSVGPTFGGTALPAGFTTQLDGMLATGSSHQLDAHSRLHSQDLHSALSPPQSSPGLPNVSSGLVNWYSHGHHHGGYDHDHHQRLSQVNQIPLALTNDTATPDFCSINDESTVSLTPESQTYSEFSAN
ncbi:hypothetical protein LPJ64_003437 [Coemansia asiatica]|uniref:GATA-type domain-containing protein n=1 Tax=Coemansia asiatica TaxID=1052880 RepID=A0A9W7XJQ8_9FUNG|nr:hypothetical protein LPJ64_003437 [Coemansia asiatica]